MEPPSSTAPRGEPSGALDFVRAASLMLATALRLLGGRRAHLYRLDPDGETFTRVAAAGEGDAKTQHGGATSADMALSGRAGRRGSPGGRAGGGHSRARRPDGAALYGSGDGPSVRLRRPSRSPPRKRAKSRRAGPAAARGVRAGSGRSTHQRDPGPGHRE